MWRSALLLLLAGCAEDRELFDVPTILVGSEPAFAPADGVQVTLDEAALTIGALRLQAPSATARRWHGVSVMPVAHAHPGHDFTGDVRGELLGPWTVDLLGDDLLLGTASCYEGPYATARMTLLPDPVALLAGTAMVGSEARTFRFELAIDQEVTGLPFDAYLDAQAPPAGITLSVDLAHALYFVDWTTADADADGVLTLADGALANTVLFGVVATPTYHLALEE